MRLPIFSSLHHATIRRRHKMRFTYRSPSSATSASSRVALETIAAGNPSGSDRKRTLGLLPGRVHVPVQSPQVRISRQTVLPASPTSRTNRSGPIQFTYQTTICREWLSQVNTPISEWHSTKPTSVAQENFCVTCLAIYHWLFLFVNSLSKGFNINPTFGTHLYLCQNRIFTNRTNTFSDSVTIFVMGKSVRS